MRVSSDDILSNLFQMLTGLLCVSVCLGLENVSDHCSTSQVHSVHHLPAVTIVCASLLRHRFVCVLSEMLADTVLKFILVDRN